MDDWTLRRDLEYIDSVAEHLVDVKLATQITDATLRRGHHPSIFAIEIKHLVEKFGYRIDSDQLRAPAP